MRIRCKELLMAFVIMLGSNTMGTVGIYPSPTAKAIQAHHHLSETSFEWSFYNSVAFLFAIMGPFFTKFLLNRFGGKRRHTIFIIDVISTISWLLNCTTKLNIWAGIVSRGLLGISMGAFSSISPMYLIEISPPDASGFFGSLNQIGIVIGQCFFSLIGKFVDYMGLNFIGAAISFLQSILIWFIIESPSVKIPESSNSKINSSHESLFQKKYLNGIIIGVALMFFQQFSGINGILTNLSSIMTTAGLDLDPNYQSAISILSQLIAVFIGSLLIDKLGRKTVWILSSAISTVSLLVMALNEKFNWSSVLPLVCIFSYQLGFGLGLGPIPWFLIPEYFADDIRPAATMVCTISNWIFAFIIVMCFPEMKAKMEMFGVTLLFMVVCAVSTIFGAFKITEPERNNDGFELIQ